MKNDLKIAVLVDVSRTYDRDVLTGITSFNRIYDKFQFFFYTPKYVDKQSQKMLVERLKAWQPDGILTREVEGFESLLHLGIPLIIFPHTNLYKDHINVWGDNMAIGEMAAGHFISKGYKHFAFLGFKDFQWSLERQQGYMEAAKQAGCSVNAFLYDHTTLLWEHLSERLTKWLSTLQRPCAIFTATDELNIPLLEAAKQCAARVPDDFSIIGVDNDTMVCEMTTPTLSSIDHNARHAGFLAASALGQWIETGEKPAGDIVVKPLTIIARNSTNALAIDDEQVRTALHYIATTAPSQDISVVDVVRATSLSRRILEKRFQLLVRSSILDEIRKVRIERIKYLLTHSELSLQQIASELNFKSFDNITRYFKQYTGWKPLEYRRQFRKA
ncbi:DNA-binding transcriptional regulator [Chitinophagaceae bacterium LB-8]|uniref:DNA-binding transcriptional regulator n=1 Tax=Paraflavisolibacter caeni TaxID=2982496 RepID=A0A9X2Y110_9BACT|nr:DNA-binding transcriptional regulator [Paraflavisolibacter caeni]MCU7552567.1 DNA-binding transcriptional regulator [Paraflavisolibacter caeni]